MKKYLLFALAAACVPGVAAAQDAPAASSPAQNFDGFRIEGRLGYETPTVSSDGEVYKIGDGPSFGGEVGFDFAVGRNVVVGPYATYEFSTVDNCDVDACVTVDENLGVGGQVGYAASANTMIYGKLGYANLKISVIDGTLTASENQSGIQGAIGADFNLSRQLYARVEANYADYGDFGIIHLQRRHVAAAIGMRF